MTRQTMMFENDPKFFDANEICSREQDPKPKTMSCIGLAQRQ